MKTQAAFASLFAAVMASPLASREVPYGWNVLGFKAECIPRSVCTYAFDLRDAFGEMLAHCSVSAQPLGVGSLPSIPQRTSDDNTVFKWGVNRNTDGSLSLSIEEFVNSTTHLGNTRLIGADQLEIIPDGAVQYEVYTGPTDLTFPVVWMSV